MENKEFYYIRGNAKRGAEVIKMLKEKGGVICDCASGKCETAYYFIGDDGIIHVVSISLIKSLFKAHGTELKLPTELEDKQLVWCWGYHDDKTQGIVRFYDAVNNCTFTYDGSRGGEKFHNYEPYQGEWPDWAKEALELLED